MQVAVRHQQLGVQQSCSRPSSMHVCAGMLQRAVVSLARQKRCRACRGRVVAQAGPNGRGPAATAPKPAGKPAAPSSAGPRAFTNTNRFVVPRHAEAAFLEAWRQREQDMQDFGGFQGFNIIHDGDVYTVSSRWASIPEWETWSLSPQCRRSHLPLGIWQFVPKKGEGFPEDFVFIQNYDEPVTAKY